MLLDGVTVLRKNGVHTIGVQRARVHIEVIRDMVLCAAALYEDKFQIAVELQSNNQSSPLLCRTDRARESHERREEL
jgi:hypothetical protein